MGFFSYHTQWKLIGLCFILIVVGLRVGPVIAQEQQATIEYVAKDTVEAASISAQEIEPTPTPTLIVPEPPRASTNLTVSPSSLQLQTEPGREVSSIIKILNNASSREYLYLELQKFRASNEGNSPIIEEFEPTDIAQEWVQFSESEFIVEPGEWKTVRVSFAPPEGSSLSYYYAVVVKRQLDPQNENVTAVFSGAPAILVLTTIEAQNIRRELELVSFRSTKRFYEFLPVEFEVEIANIGNVHVAPLGNIFIDSHAAKDIAVLSFNKANGLVLPGSTRIYNTPWEDGFPRYEIKTEFGEKVRNADGNLVYTLKWDLSRADMFRFGKYTAHLLMAYDDGQRDVPMEATVSFWVVPWRFLGGVVVVVVGSIVWFVIQQKRARKLKQQLAELELQNKKLQESLKELPT